MRAKFNYLCLGNTRIDPVDVKEIIECSDVRVILKLKKVRGEVVFKKDKFPYSVWRSFIDQIRYVFDVD